MIVAALGMALVLVAAPSASGAGVQVASKAAPADCPRIKLFNARFDVTATAHVAKLGGATLASTGVLHVDLFGDLANCDLKAVITGTIGLGPAFGYFVAFRFVPATSRADFPDGTVTSTPFTAPDPLHPTVDSRATVRLALTCVKQGGRPVFPKVGETAEQVCAKQVGVDLNVGGGCQSTLTIPLKGTINFADLGSTTTLPDSVFEIPPFHGCGNSSENLDPLITGLVSGPGNVIGTTLVLTCRQPANLPPCP